MAKRERKTRIPGEPATGSAEQTPSPELQAEVDLAYQCGLYGASPIETEAKIGGHYQKVAALVKAYEKGHAEHAFTVRKSMYELAVYDKNPMMLKWLAENSLQSLQGATNDAIISSMTPEERREQIKALTKKLGLEVAS